MKLINKSKTAENARIKRLFGKKKKTRVSYQNFGLFLAGTVGFEPTNGGVKVRCLTAWLRPSIFKARLLYTKKLSVSSHKAKIFIIVSCKITLFF